MSFAVFLNVYSIHSLASAIVSAELDGSRQILADEGTDDTGCREGRPRRNPGA